MIARLRPRPDRDEGGYTLIELLIVTIIAPLVIGSICVALIAVLSLQGGVSHRISDAADAQVVSAHLDQDVQSAAGITTSPLVQCGASSGTQLLGLEWNVSATFDTAQTVVSYVKVQSGTTYSLVRNYCASGPSATPTSSSLVSSDISASQVGPSITPPNATALAAGWVTTQGITGVSFAITEPGSNYAYTLVALPAAGAYPSPVVSNAPQETSCAFAKPGTGTYASTLCFVGFPAQAAGGTQCQNDYAAVAGTPFTISFCLLVTGASVKATFMPTYPEAFLGNTSPSGTPFYTGIPNNAALYQTAAGTTVATITNIEVVDQNGNAATGWSLVTGDAETTDSGESMIWQSDQKLTLLPNTLGGTTAAAEIGNTCEYSPAPAGTAFPNTWLTGNGTSTVECAANSAETGALKTGTVMLSAPTPTTLTVTMHGSGLEALFVGLLLP